MKKWVPVILIIAFVLSIFPAPVFCGQLSKRDIIQKYERALELYRRKGKDTADANEIKTLVEAAKKDWKNRNFRAADRKLDQALMILNKSLVDTKIGVNVATIGTRRSVWSLDAADLDHDGKVEIVTSQLDGGVYCQNLKGKTVWKYDLNAIAYAIACGDITADEKLEVVLASGDREGSIYLLDYRGKPIWKYTANNTFYAVAIGDHDIDGKKDIFAAGVDKCLYLIDGKGKLLFKKQVYPEAISSIAVGNLIGNKKPEVVVGGRGGAIALSNKGDNLWEYHTIKGKQYFDLVSSIDIGDIDNDGHNEVVVGGRPLGTVSAIRGDGSPIWQKRRICRPGRYSPYAQPLVKIASLFPEKYRQIIVMHQDKSMAIVDHKGSIIFRSLPELKTPTPRFFSYSVTDSGPGNTSKIIAGGGMRDHNIYLLEMNKTGKNLLPQFSRPYPQDFSLQALRRKIIQAPQAKVRKTGRKVHVLIDYKCSSRGLPHDKLVIRKLAKFLKRKGTPNLEFELAFTTQEKSSRTSKAGILATVKKEDFKPQKEIIELAKFCEKEEIGFYFWVMHFGTPFLQIDTIQKIMEVAPNSCRGFTVCENIGFYPDTRQWKKFIDYTKKILELCRRYGDKKFIFNEPAQSFYLLAQDKKTFNIFFRPEYQDVVVPMFKSSEPVGSELSLGSLVGLWKGGIIKEWGFQSNSDSWKFKAEKYCLPRVTPADVILRMELMAVSLGATYLKIENGQEYFSPAPPLGFSGKVEDDALLHRDLIHELIRKNFLSPPLPRELIICPVVFKQRFNKAIRRYRSLYFNTTIIDSPLSQGFLGNRDFLQRTLDFNAPSYLYGSRYYGDSIFPKTPFGFIAIIPSFIDPLKVSGAKAFIQTDGNFLYKATKRLTAQEAKKRVLATFRKWAEDLPFKCENAFMSILEKKGDEYELILIDPLMLEPLGTEAKLKIRLSRRVKIVDAISGETFKPVNKVAQIAIPSGGFRILKVLPTEK